MENFRDNLEALSKRANEGSKVPEEPGAVRANSSRDEESPRPEIVIGGRQIRDIVTNIVYALIEKNSPPFLFTMNGQYIELLGEGASTTGCRPVSKESLERYISEFCNVVRQANRPQTATSVPRQVISHILSDPDLPFPELRSITYLPIVRPDGTIVETPGYDTVTMTYYVKRDNIQAVPLAPSRQQVEDARALLKDTIVDFKFETEVSAVNYLALLLSVVLRPAIQSRVPLFVITSPIAGSGKTLLACGTGIVHDGNTPSMRTMPQSESELKKWLMSELVCLPGMIIVDNVKQRVVSPSLASAQTAESFTDRLLGSNTQKVTCAIRAIFVMTGNNVTCDFDIARRCVPICLDPKTSKPELRSGFRHPDFEKMMYQLRDSIVHSIFVLYRNWFTAGKPIVPQKPFGSFQEWADTIGGILFRAGFNGFLENKSKFMEAADGDTQEWEDFLNCCHTIFNNDSFKVKDLIQSINKDSHMEETCPAELADILGLSKGINVKVGLLLKSKLGRRYGDRGIHLAQAGRNQYRIELSSDEPERMEE